MNESHTNGGVNHSAQGRTQGDVRAWRFLEQADTLKADSTGVRTWEAKSRAHLCHSKPSSLGPVTSLL